MNLIRFTSFFLFFIPLFFAMACKQAENAGKARLYLASSLASLASDIDQLSRGSIEAIFLTSSAIARQIKEGALCDGVIVADEVWRDFLLKHHAVEPKY